MDKKVGDILLELGITPNLKGFTYILELVDLINNDGLMKITAGYQIVAKRHDIKKWETIERSTRTAIGKANADSESFKEYFEEFVNEKTKKVPNGVFLFTLAFKTKEDLDGTFITNRDQH